MSSASFLDKLRLRETYLKFWRDYFLRWNDVLRYQILVLQLLYSVDVSRSDFLNILQSIILPLNLNFSYFNNINLLSV